VDRTCGPMDKNRIEGGADQGEWASIHEALVTKGRCRKSGGRARKEVRSSLGRSRLMPERVTVLSRSEKSAKVVFAGESQ
jgi:hypothetical protein